MLTESIYQLQRSQHVLPNHPWIRKATNFSLRILSLVGGSAYSSELRDIDAFCLFVGHPRSGHTLLGALLDAHPHMTVAHELHSLRYVGQGVTKQELYYLLLSRARWFKQRGCVTNQYIEKPGYDYEVPSQYQGQYQQPLRVIGDKRGGGTAHLLTKHPGLLKQLQSLVGIPVKVIHVTRHPYDNISTLARKHHAGDVDAAIEHYQHLFHGVERAKEQTADENWQTVAHENLISESKATLRSVCAFLGVGVQQSYLDVCSGIIFDSPSRARDKITYSGQHIEKIREVKGQHPELSRYKIGSNCAGWL